MAMFTNKRIMVVAAHPDDELLGLGATMHKLVKTQGVQTRVIIMGEGITSRSDTRDTEQWKEVLERHHQNVETARQLIGYHSVQAYNFSDNRFDSHALLDIVKVVEHEKEQFRPDFIFTHHGGDLNIDHQMTFQAVMTATRPMAAYEFESRAFPHPRSSEALKALARFRGYTVGKHLAEAFQIVRMIE